MRFSPKRALLDFDRLFSVGNSRAASYAQWVIGSSHRVKDLRLHHQNQDGARRLIRPPKVLSRKILSSRKCWTVRRSFKQSLVRQAYQKSAQLQSCDCQKVRIREFSIKLIRAGWEIRVVGRTGRGYYCYFKKGLFLIKIFDISDPNGWINLMA